jgi:general secretion pathway protein D
MPFFNRLVAAVLAAVLVGPAVPLEAKTRKGDRFLSDGRTQERKKDWDGALNSYERALSEDPSDVVYQMAAQKTRFQASQAHLDAGFKARAEGQLGDALIEFQRAFGINPGSSVADQEIRRTQQMIERERRRLQETGKEASPEEKALTPSEEAKKQVRDKIERMLPVPELKPLNNEPINLKMNNQTPKVLFETVAKVAGLNVIWDPEYQPGRNLSIELNNSTYDEALDDLAVLTKSFWKPLSANTIFITNDNRNKRNDYEEQVLKVFYLSNVNTPQELQEIVNAVRAVTELTRLMPYNSQNAIIARGEADRVALAEKIITEKIITDLDKPKAEVVIDVLVLQASQVFSRKITAALAPTGLNVPVNFTPRGGLRVVTDATTPATTTPATTSTATTPTVPATTTPAAAINAIPLQNLGRLASSDFSITLPGALLQAALSDATTKILQSPQVRSVDNVKASLKIGEREPTATGSFQPGIGGVGINPLVNTQFTYIDVGVNVDLTPRVHDNNEISMHVDLDISSVAGTVNLGGIEQPIIQQNKISHDLRVREGEVSLLAGLVQHQESKSVTGIPGLSSIPLIRRLFSGESVDRNNSELMIALIPHIVRRPDISPENLRGIAVGNATTIKLNYAPLPSQAAPARPAAAAPVPAAPPAATPAAVAPPNPVPVLPPAAVNAPPATAPPPTAAPLPPGLPPATAPTAPPPAPNTPPAAGGRLFFQPAQVDIGLSAAITVAVAVDGVADVASAPMQIQFDPRIVRLNNVSIGDFLAQGGSPPSFTQNILNDTGTATIQLARLPGTPGASGTGVLVNLNFQAVGRGAATVTIPNLTLLNSQSQVVARGTPQLTVNVK